MNRPPHWSYTLIAVTGNAPYTFKEALDPMLYDGWEPFAVTSYDAGIHVHLRRSSPNVADIVHRPSSTLHRCYRPGLVALSFLPALVLGWLLAYLLR